MALNLSAATEADADRIAAIHMAAFGGNLMLRAQFPTAAIRDMLRISIAKKTVDDIKDPKIAVLVVRDKNEIISFGKWSLPVLESDTYVETPWIWPEGTNLAVLDGWTDIIEAAKLKTLGNSPCYRLSFLGTDPRHERRGAASLLLQWGLEHCKRDNVPAYLESTADGGPLYERHGFEAVEKLSMALVETAENGAMVVYEETCFIFRPSLASCTTEPLIHSTF